MASQTRQLSLGRAYSTAFSVLVLLARVAIVAAAQPPGGAIEGTVSSPAGQPLPDVVVTLSAEDMDDRYQLTGSRGDFRFEGLRPRTYTLDVALPGYEPYAVPVTVGEEEGEMGLVRLDIMLEIRRISESVQIQAQVSEGEVDPGATPIELAIDELDLLPLPTDRFQEAFPLVPGVVRDPEGRLSFNGARPSQSTLLVNGANATDPLTGEFAVELPLRAIEAVEVNTLPYSAEYGQVTAAVARVTTRGGTDEWDVEFGDLLPKFNFRDGKIKGIRAAVPQVGVSGPILKGHLWFSQGFGVRFVRSRIYDPVDEGEDERILEGLDTFTQIDWRMAKNHQLTTTFSYFPVEWDNYQLDALTSPAAAPEFNSWGWNAAISERSTFSRTVIETILAVKSFDVAVRPGSTEQALLTPDGPRENYFNILNRESSREEIAFICTHALSEPGDSILKFGGNLSHRSFRGTDESLPVSIRDGEGNLLRSIEWVGDPSIGGSDVRAALFVQQQWRLTDRLGFEAGLRYDYDRLVDQHQLAPRIAAAYALDEAGRTVVKGGFGIFYDHVQLHIDSFERFQDRLETRYDASGRPAEDPVRFRPRIAPEGLELPRSYQWNVELDHFLSPGLEARVNYRERRGSREHIVERLRRDGEGTLLLSSRGASTSRELDLTLRISGSEDSELFVAYSKARTTGDLNNFASLYGNFRSPLLFDNERSLLDLDVPHRALAWGIWYLPKDIRISPGLEWRSGFPYTVFEEDYSPSGARNQGGRFPSFLSFDLRVTKGLELFGRSVRVGFQFFNLASHFNPRDVVSNQGSERFGTFLNSVDMSLGIRLSLGL